MLRFLADSRLARNPNLYFEIGSRGATNGKFHLSIKDGDGKPKLGEHIPIEFDTFENLWIGHPDPNIDQTIFAIAPLFTRSLPGCPLVRDS